MAPIRIGLIGLSGAPADKYEGAGWAARAHLPYLTASPHYEIVALLNTSVDSAKAAIAKYELPNETKAYGDPEDLAADGDVDLVVCCVRVDQHFQSIRPSIIAGKAVFIEWPLERNLEVVREMAALATKHNAPTVVGIQGAFGLTVRKMKEVIDSGRIGKVVSSSWTTNSGNGGATEIKNFRSFVDREIGANLFTIGVGHSLEFLAYVLGELKSYDSLMAIGHHTVDLIDPANGKVVDKGVRNTVPNQVMIQGTVAPSNAIVNFQWRGGKQFPGTHAADWRVVGDKGELRLTSSSWALNLVPPDTKLEVFDTTTGAVESIGVDKDQWDSLPGPASTIARLYEAYRLQKWYPDFDWAIKRHEVIEEMWNRFDASN